MLPQDEARKQEELKLIRLLKPIIEDKDMGFCMSLVCRERNLTTALIRYLESHPDADEEEVQRWLWPEDFEDDEDFESDADGEDTNEDDPGRS